MEKVNLNAKLKSVEDDLDINTVGVINKNKIIYQEDNINVTILIFDNKIEMNRTCNEYKIKLIFEKNNHTVSTYNVFGAPKVFSLDLFTTKLNIDDKRIEIEYILGENKFYYCLNIGGKYDN